MKTSHYFVSIIYFLHAPCVLLAEQGRGLVFTENKGQVVDMRHSLQSQILFTADDEKGLKVFFQKTLKK